MAFNPNAAAETNTAWKAQGFLNIYLPSKGPSGRRKLGAIPLRDSNVNEKELLVMLANDPAFVAKIVGKMIVEYQSATPAEGTGFDLD